MLPLPASPRGIAPLAKGRSKWDLFFVKSAEKKYQTVYQQDPRPTTAGAPGAGAGAGDDDDEEYKNLIRQLQEEISFKNQTIQELQSQLESLSSSSSSSSVILQRKHHFLNETYLITDEGHERVPLATRGSILTTNILRTIPESQETPLITLASRMIHTFHHPLDHMTYLNSHEFANDLIELSYALCDLLENESRCLFLQSPVYVIGDIHGNLEDLHFFSDNLWKLGMELSAGKYLFLGDYVDRGMNCLECVAYLFALKLLHPSKIYLLRGNHETRSVNGWEEHYKTKSFLYQCKDRFGQGLGESVWDEVNQCFDRLPLAAIIDHDIFCIHGGIPRPLNTSETAIEAILQLPSLLGVNPSFEHETDSMIQLASDCLWSDPANEEQEKIVDDKGFGPSLRGHDCVCFGMKAINDFLQRNYLSFIIRAHEAHAHGVCLSKSGKVFTVFSTSRDHGQGHGAVAGCILVDVDKIQVINRSPAYKNKYIHHRTSIGCDLTDDQLHEMSRLGLLRMDSLERKV